MSVIKCIVSIGFLMFVTGLAAQNRVADYGLIGKVKRLYSVTHPVGNAGKTEVSGFLDSENFNAVLLKFDSQMNLIFEENYLDYGGNLGVFDRTNYQINPNNQIEKSETTLIKNNKNSSKISQRKTYYYLGNLLIRTDEFNSGRTSDQYWVVNSVYENNRLNEKVYWMEDAVFSRTKFEFDNNYNPLSEKTYHNNGQLGKTVLYENNKSGLPLKITSLSGNEENTEIITYNSSYKIKHEYFDNRNKLLKSEEFDEFGRVKKVRKINYNRHDFDEFEFNYKSDNKNNWVSCEISKNGIPAFEIRREIEYY